VPSDVYCLDTEEVSLKNSRIKKEMHIAEVLSQHLSGRAQENHTKTSLLG
jgi:hypothetical protein